jgi:hypothetical protein
VTRVLSALAATTLAFVAIEARADFREAGAITVNLRGGGQIRRDRGYGDDAEAFGFGRIAQGGGGGLELYAAPWKRVSFGASFGGFSSSAKRDTTTLTLSSQAWLAHVRVTPWRQILRAGQQAFLLELDADVAAGLYAMKRTYDDATLYPSSIVASDRSGGLRVGVDVAGYWHAIGLVVGYAYAYAPARVTDRVGGAIQAGGHEFTGALSLRW